jgi:hypothetical protein
MAQIFDVETVPDYYANHGVTRWSQSKLRCPLPYFVAEYIYRQPRYWEAVRAVEAGDAEAEQRKAHYYKPPSIQMRAGTAVHEAAFRIIERTFGDSAYCDATRGAHGAFALSELDRHSPASWNERDQILTDHLLSDSGSQISATIENSVAGVREAFAGANQIAFEEQISLDLPGIEVPVVGYADGRGGGVIGELKTRWDSISRTAKSGFATRSLPTRPEVRDIAQVALYQAGLEEGADCKLIYANHRGYVVHQVEQPQLDEAMAITKAILRKRQQLLKRNTTMAELIECCEPDWSDFRWRDFSPELLAEIKQVMHGD